MHQKQQQQQQAHDHNTKRLRSFLPGDVVAVRLLFRGQEKWAQGEVIQRLGPVSYMVRINNKVSHVHIDHLVAATKSAPFNDAQLAETIPEKPLSSKSPDAEVRNPAHTLDLTPEVLPPVPEADASRTAEVPDTPAKAWNQPEKGMAATTPAKEPDRSSPGRRYPARRTRKPPERLDH